MAQIKNQLQNSKKNILLGLVLAISVFTGCVHNLVDVNVQIPDHKWTYRNHLKTAFEIKDHTKAYHIFFKLRHTAEYRYSNIFVLVHFKDGLKTVTKRYQYKVAKNDGEWLGSGSGNLFSYTFPLLTNYHFEKNGKFEIEVEQNMRDNPLTGVSDIGILIEEASGN